MAARLDVVGKIQQMYDAGKQPIPYATFMRVFNELLQDRVKVVPWEPADELREHFRAVCMAVSAGVLDVEDRGPQRIEEFRTKVYPVWKAKLPPEEFKEYEQILEGAPPGEEGPGRQEWFARAKAEQRSRELSAKLGLKELETEEAAAPAAKEAEPARQAPVRFADVNELCDAIRRGDVEVRWDSARTEGDIARYGFQGVEVVARVARRGQKEYVVLTAGLGRLAVRNPEERIDEFAAEMRYRRRADYAYVRRDEEFVYTMRVGPNTTNVACTSVEAGGEDDIIRRIEKLHWDLGELVERMRSSAR